MTLLIPREEAETLALAVLLSGKWENIEPLCHHYCDRHGIYGSYGFDRHIVWNDIYLAALRLQGEHFMAEDRRTRGNFPEEETRQQWEY